MRFGLVRLTLKIKSEPNQMKPNQCGFGWIGWCSFFRDDTIFCFQHENQVKKLKHNIFSAMF